MVYYTQVYLPTIINDTARVINEKERKRGHNIEHHSRVANGRVSIVNRALDGSTYPG